MFYFYVLVGACAVVKELSAVPAAPYGIRVEHYKIDTTKDLVVNTGRPRFSWKLSTSTDERNIQQVAYQLQIKSRVDQWDSEQVFTDQSTHASYTGSNDLRSATLYEFRLRIWTTQSNEASAWTDWIHFRTFLFDIDAYITSNNDSLIWIGSNQINMNELRKEFQVPSSSPIRSAIAYISGLGYYELYVNGNKVDASRKLDPGWTVYEKRTLLVSFDLSSTIKVRANKV